MAAFQVCVEGAGNTDKVSVCSGEDWWLPEEVGYAQDGGHVISRGWPIECWQNDLVTMEESSTKWEDILDTDGDGSVTAEEAEASYGGGSILSYNDSLNTVLDRYLYSQGESYEKKIHYNAFGGSDEGLGAHYINESGVPLLKTYLDEKVADGTISQTDLDEWWADVVRYHGSSASLIYTFWNEDFLAERKKYLALWGSHFNTYANEAGESPLSQLEQFNFNSENCYITQYLTTGLWSPSELDGHVRNLIATADLGSSSPPISADKLLLNICNGGRAQYEYADAAKNYGTGIGNHGFANMLRLSFQSLLDNTYYDTDLKTYRQTGRFPYGFIHTDETHIQQNGNTWGNYRMFRHMITAALSLGVNRILIDKSAIASEGRYIREGLCGVATDSSDTRSVPGWDAVYDATGAFQQTCPMGSDENVTCDESTGTFECEADNENYFCNFDWDAIDEEGAKEFLQWTNKIVGTTAQSAPEAYCSLAQTGTPLPEGTTESDFTSALDACYGLEDWGEVSSSGGTCKWYDYYKTPVLSYSGRHCDLDQTISGGQATPVLLLGEERLKGETVPDPASSAFGGTVVYDGAGATLDEDGDGAADRTSVFYEGKSTDHPQWEVLSDATTVGTLSADGGFEHSSQRNYALYFKLHDDFVRPGTSIPVVPPQTYGDKELAVYGSIKDAYPNFDAALSGVDVPESDYSIKVFYENHTGNAGKWRLEYDSVGGWKEGPEVTVSSTSSGIKTATFRLNDAMFANRGDGGADFALRTVNGYSPAFLHVRIIKLDKEDYDDDGDGLANSVDPNVNQTNVWGYIDKDIKKRACLHETLMKQYRYVSGMKFDASRDGSIKVAGVTDAAKASTKYRCGGESAPSSFSYGIYIVTDMAQGLIR